MTAKDVAAALETERARMETDPAMARVFSMYRDLYDNGIAALKSGARFEFERHPPAGMRIVTVSTTNQHWRLSFPAE